MNLMLLANETLFPPTDLTVDAGGLLAPFVLVFVLAFAVTFMLTPIMRLTAVRFGVVDQPDYQRKAHLEPVAYLGGAALLVGWLVGIGATYFLSMPEAEDNIGVLLQPMRFPFWVMVGAVVITATGLWDDIFGVSPRIKVGGQLFAAAALAKGNVATGLVSDTFDLVGVGIPPGLAYAVATVFIGVLVVGGCNAMNLLDGLDGLASGVAAIAFIGFLFIVTIFALRVVNSDVAVAPDNIEYIKQVHVLPIIIVMCLAALGATLGFLPYNFNPANIFMGDAGSLLLGYLSAATILLFAETPAEFDGGQTRGPLLVMAALIVFAVPICDTMLAIFRRKMRGKPILSPDNQHIHHLLIHAGFGVKKSVAIMYLFGVVCAVLGGSLIYMRLGGRFVAPVFMVLFAFVMATAYKNGHRHAVIEQIQDQRQRRKHDHADQDDLDAEDDDQTIPPQKASSPSVTVKS